MKITFLLFSILLQLSSSAQETQEEMNKMLKKLQENTAKGQKELQRQADSLLKEMELQKTNHKLNIPSNDEDEKDEERLLLKLPQKNQKLLALLPKTVLSKPQLVIYLQNLKTQLQKKIDPLKLKDANHAIVILNGQTEKLHENAISAWYNGAQQEATLLLLEASHKLDDGLLLNNLSAFLNMGGAPHKAIPILKNLLVSYPDNSFVLNNLGQSYANLGEADSAMYYLTRCLKIAPMHAKANHTAGVIEAEKGNTAEAEAHFTKAIKASQSQKSVEALKKLNSKIDLVKLVKPKIKVGQYFNPDKYQLPQQCTNVNDAVKAAQEHLDFENWMMQLQEDYIAIRDISDESGTNKLKRDAATLKQNMSAGVKPDYTISPFSYYGNYMWVILLPYLNDLSADVDKFVQEKEKQISARGNAYAKEIDKYYDDQSAAIDAASNRYLQDVSEIRKAIQEKQMLVAKLTFENYAYYRYLGGVNKQLADGAFYDAARVYLSDLQKIAKTETIPPHRSNVGDLAPREKDKEKLAKMDCPINININFVVGKLKIDCEKFSFTGGEGVRFKYEKNFESGASSLGIGIGLGFDVGVGTGIKAGISAEVAEYLYVEFDKDNNLNDVGLEVTARVSEQVQAKTDNIKVSDRPSELKAGYKIGVNSGINFTGNVFKALN